MVILVVFKGFLLVKNLEILIQIVPDHSIYYYLFYRGHMLPGNAKHSTFAKKKKKKKKKLERLWQTFFKCNNIIDIAIKCYFILLQYNRYYIMNLKYIIRNHV